MKTPEEIKSIGYTIGQCLAITVVGCIAVCLAGAAVGATVKFLTWIF